MLGTGCHVLQVHIGPSFLLDPGLVWSAPACVITIAATAVAHGVSCEGTILVPASLSEMSERGYLGTTTVHTARLGKVVR
ncbi:hypothetical protein LZ31DRAFT_156646 [Colletotrichum somersetense]|nr:hypothetical protein LZ31DRAFT_156646 [Colletotrichum somersetense]